MILITYGTRPEYIKILPILKELKNNSVKFKTLFTGQHKDIVEDKSDFSLKLIKDDGDNRLDSIIKNCLTIPEDYFKDITHILVQGDTTSVLGLSIASFHRKIKIIHLEAGLRTWDFDNPYPEEINRQLVSRIADIHLCPTEYNKLNLLKENIDSEKIYVVGNTVLDNLVSYIEKCEYTNKVLVTMHRRENHDELKEWFTTINDLSKEHPELEFILPLHPNPNVQKWKHILTNVNVIEPLSHQDLIELLIKVKLVITDSGGIQEECSFLNKKCLVCRKTTERPESLNLTSFIVDNPDKLKTIFEKHLLEFNIDLKSPYGDGYSSEKIVEILKTII